MFSKSREHSAIISLLTTQSCSDCQFQFIPRSSAKFDPFNVTAISSDLSSYCDFRRTGKRLPTREGAKDKMLCTR